MYGLNLVLNTQKCQTLLDYQTKTVALLELRQSETEMERFPELTTFHLMSPQKWRYGGTLTWCSSHAAVLQYKKVHWQQPLVLLHIKHKTMTVNLTICINPKLFCLEEAGSTDCLCHFFLGIISFYNLFFPPIFTLNAAIWCSALVCYPLCRGNTAHLVAKWAKPEGKITGLSLWTTAVKPRLCVWRVILGRDASWGPRRCHFKFVSVTPFGSGWTDASEKLVGQPEIHRQPPPLPHGSCWPFAAFSF